MPERSRKPDLNTRAFDTLNQIIGETPKNPAAVSLGRLGGLKGGVARAKALTKKQRSEIAKIAAAARWKKKED